jgi:hypothetical protein
VAGAFSAALAIGTLALADALRYPQTPTRVQIDATVIASFDNHDETLTRFGSLEFRGGLVLTSRHPAFGGISAIHVEPDGNRFIAITDRGSWLRGRIVYRQTGWHCRRRNGADPWIRRKAAGGARLVRCRVAHRT